MNTNQPLSDQMEAYLQGMLSADQESDFLARVERDPLLKGELTLQRDIVEGIRTERRLQLKQRLKGIDVAAPAPGGAAAWLRPMGYAAGGAAAVGLLIWALGTNEPKARPEERQTTRTEQTTADQSTNAAADAANAGTPATADPAVAAAPDHGQAPGEGNVLSEGQSMQNAELPQLPAEEATTMDAANPPVTHSAVRGKRTASADAGAATNPARTKQSSRAAKVDADAHDDMEHEGVENPDIRATGSSHNFNGKGELSVPSGKIANETETTGKPEVVITESDKLAYQYYENKLYLYGGFGGELYELIEVHARQEKRLYVYYLDQFYLVRNNTRAVTDLEPIKDENTIQELERLRKRRVE